MKYYKVKSSHWPMEFEFKSKLKLSEGLCFKITNNDGDKKYPTRFKVLSVSDTPEYTGRIVEILDINTNVETF